MPQPQFTDRTRLVRALGKAEGMRNALRFHPDHEDPFFVLAISMLDELAADLAEGVGLPRKPLTEERS